MPRVIVPVLFSLFVIGTLRGADWPQWMGERRDGVWSETGILEKFPRSGPKLLWRHKIAGGYAGPAVADGLVFVTDYVTDADTFGLSDPDKRAKTKGRERVLCLSAKDGSQVWKHEYDCAYQISYPSGPRCTPTVSGGKVYALGAMGNLFCFDAKKGTILWEKDFTQAPFNAKVPFWGYSGHPLIDGDRLICLVGGKDSALVAFHKDTGKELWRSLDGNDVGYCSPSIIKAGGKRQLLIWLPDGVYSTNPETGEQYWSAALKPAYGMSIVAPQKSGDYLFTGGIGGKSVVLKLASDRPTVSEVWRTDAPGNIGVFPVNSTPFLEGDTIYGVDKPGQLRGVDIKTGERLWETTSPITGARAANTGTAFLTKNGDRFLVFNEQGELVLAKLGRKGYEEIDRAKLLEPTSSCFGRKVVWSHPAYANKCVFARNDKEIVCYSLAE